MNMKVSINDVHGSQMAAKINGTFTIDSNSFRFNAIAFGRIGGHNISAKISKSTEKSIRNLGYNVDKVIDELQKSLLEGNISLPKGLKREAFVDD